MNKRITILFAIIINVKMFSAQQYIIENRGKMYFYKDTALVKYPIPLKPYYDNANKIRDTMYRLDSICNELQNFSRCETNVKEFKEDMENIKNDIGFFKRISNVDKRFAKKSVIKFIVQSIGGLAVAGLTWSKVDDMKTKEITLETNQDILNAEKYIKYEENRNQILTHTKFSEYDDLMRTLIALKSKHIIDTAKYKQILGNEPLRNIFEIIDYEELNFILNETNAELAPNRMLPKLNVFNLFKLGKLKTLKTQSHINISLRLPIVTTEATDLNEIIPIPFNESGYTKIFDINSTMFIHENGTKIQCFF